MIQQRPEGKSLSIWKSGIIGVPVRVLLDALWLQWRIVLLPWQALVFWVSCCTGVMVKFLTVAGAPPVSFRDKLKLTEKQKIIEHLHQREDGFRRKIREMYATIEARTREVRRLETKLAKMQREAIASSELARSESAHLPPGPEPRGHPRLAKHFFFLAAGVLPMYWMVQQPDIPAVSRKLGWSVFMPEALLYLFSLMGAGPQSSGAIIQCCSLFLSGFVFCHWLHQVG